MYFLRLNPRAATLTLLLGLTASGAASAREDVNRPLSARPSQANRINTACLYSSSKAQLDINNVRAMVLNGGDMWWDLNNPRYEVPKEDDPNRPKRHSLFAGAIWIGGRDASDILYTAAQTYRQGSPQEVGYWPGPLDALGNVTQQSCTDFNTHSKVNLSEIDAFRALGAGPFTPELIPESIRFWPGSGNPLLTWDGINTTPLAPFVNVGGDPDIYEPQLGDYPDIDGDQAIWWVMNDKGNGAVKQYPTPPIGIELAVEAFAFQTNDLLNNMTFYKQRIANKGNIELQNTYFGQWVDPDLGYFNDDFVGCDVGRSLGLCYNGDDLDEGVNGYGANPPTIGVDFFEGPLADPGDGIDNDRDAYDANGVFHPELVDEQGEKIIMSNFVYYNNDNSDNGNPSAAAHTYNYLRSRTKGGVRFKYGGDGLTGTSDAEYKFMFPAGGIGQSDPLGLGFDNRHTPPCAWSESNTRCDVPGTRNSPGDRRFIQSAGPFTLRPGAVNQITVGVIWGQASGGGAQGSVGLVTYADDKAQAAFDLNFQLPKGPLPVVLSATELDQQVVLAIQPTSSNGQTTEAYEDSGTINGVTITYRFEGYLVYQLANSSVTAADVSNPDKARLVGRGDLVNGVTSIVNQDFNTDVNGLVPVLKVNADNADRGIFHTLNLTTDQFAAGNNRLVNFKQYTYLVIPYAYSADRENGRPINEPYREGRATKFTVIPHKVAPENNGTVLNSTVGSGIPIQRVLGQGAGGTILEITEQDEQQILTTGQQQVLSYEVGKAPITVKVYNPKLVQSGKFTVKLASRLVYKASSLSDRARSIKVGDKLHSTGQYETSETATTTTTRGNGVSYNPNVISTSLEQKQGDAIVTRVVSRLPVADNDTVITLELQMLNDDLGGTFVGEITKYFNSNLRTGPDSFSSDAATGYGIESRPFEVVGQNLAARADDYVQSDLWRLILPNGEVRYGDRTVSEFNEQLVPEYGIAIQLRRGLNPGSQPVTQRQFQFLEATLAHSSDRWLTAVPYERPAAPRDTVIGGIRAPGVRTVEGLPWLLSANSNDGSGLLDFDPNAIYVGILPTVLRNGQQSGGTLAPYAVTSPVKGTGGGSVEAGARFDADPIFRFNRLQNVDIVMTPDPTKWTRVSVLQISDPTFTPTNPFRLTKRLSRKPSINRDGTPTNARSRYPAFADSLSRGMGWFPGYAIDLDRGIRLNMMFSEDQDSPVLTRASDPNTGQGPEKGADLVWDPDHRLNGGRNFVYVLTTKYDEGNRLERYQDSLTSIRQAPLFKRFTAQLYDSVMMWVYNPKLAPGKTKFQGGSEVRIRARVDRAFTSYPGGRPNNVNTNPEYTFELQGQAVATNQKSVACNAMDLVRVVPNPYYAFSQYETGQLDNRIKITNIPRRAEIDIYTLNGTLVRRLRKDDPNTFLDWNLRNESGLPIGSGVYLFHVKGPDVGCDKVLKWFGIMRPADLDSF